MKISLPSSGLKSEPSTKQADAGRPPHIQPDNPEGGTLILASVRNSNSIPVMNLRFRI
jgi:hypothetical protein